MTVEPADWSDLAAELDLWAAAGLTASFWWRDDDAAAPSPALDRLLDLRDLVDCPLALAIIPAQTGPALAKRLHAANGIVALQHGYAHANHSVAPDKKSELPATRALAERRADLQKGLALMQAHFADCRLPILVPPWNRLGEDLLPHLPALGFTAVSGFKSRPQYWAAPGLAWLNTHIDPIDWHGNDPAAATARSLTAGRDLLRAMRQGACPLQPVGLLTHHLRHCEAVWAFLARLFDATAGHPAVRWLDAGSALAIGRPSPTVMPAS